jgi:hypothetical protein
MDVLLERQVQWDIKVGIVARGGELLVTPYLDDPDPSFERLDGPTQVVWRTPLVVAGLLPEGVVDVEVRSVDVHRGDVLVRAPVWLAEAAIEDLVFVHADGTREPVPEPPSVEEFPPAELDDEGRAYATLVAGAIARDVVEHGPAAPLRRIVVRWFWSGDPAYLTIHVLGDGDEQPALDDTWFPLEWANVERELERTDRVLERPEVQRAAETLTATFPHDADGEVDAEAHLPAVVEIVRLLPAALATAGLELADRFAASAAHFEGWGALDVIDGLASPELRAALAEHGEMPTE